MKNVLDLTQRLKTQKNARKAKGPSAKSDGSPVVDMTEKRQEILEQERRTVRRTILSEFIGAMVVVPEKGLVKVNLYDISENGLAFDIDAKAGHFQLNEKVAMRVYLNHQTYFPFVVSVQNLRKVGDEDVYRHGAQLEKGSINDEALHHFVKFIETVSAALKSDHGDIMVSSLAR